MSQHLRLTCSWCWAVERPGTALALLLAGGLGAGLGTGLGAGLGAGLAVCLGAGLGGGHVEVTVLGLALLTHGAACRPPAPGSAAPRSGWTGSGAACRPPAPGS